MDIPVAIETDDNYPAACSSDCPFTPEQPLTTEYDAGECLLFKQELRRYYLDGGLRRRCKACMRMGQ